MVEDSVKKDDKRLYFAVLITDQSLDAVTGRNFRLFWGLGRAELRLIEKTSRKEGKDKDIQKQMVD